MSSAPSLTQVRDVFEALGPPGTPFTTPEVATKFDCTNRTIYNRLETLVEDDVLETKKVGARGRVWWHPVEKHNAERGNEQRLGALVKATMEGVYRVSPDWSEIYQLAGEGTV
ncbi:helix-turn-helix domain-containing protein [Natronomonas salsuginis]|uniref:Helix-turn-helix transcriptional regulator n=1 Tax=Natronomonas salsuginis TaxID=2217661 RepID=A0A4U5JJR6_9EURY|nr:helix-turn-helix domain-containing protein [Natronomonas salsuginis]TKR28328.1 helix-turn-helix transcriptional regulator [Natronomonas salsuginis]